MLAPEYLGAKQNLTGRHGTSTSQSFLSVCGRIRGKVRQAICLDPAPSKKRFPSCAKRYMPASMLDQRLKRVLQKHLRHTGHRRFRHALSSCQAIPCQGSLVSKNLWLCSLSCRSRCPISGHDRMVHAAPRIASPEAERLQCGRVVSIAISQTNLTAEEGGKVCATLREKKGRSGCASFRCVRMFMFHFTREAYIAASNDTGV